MPDFNTQMKREIVRAQRDPRVQASERRHAELRASSNGPSGNNNFMRGVDSMLAERDRDAARETLVEAKDELRRVKNDPDAHRDDIAYAREAVEDARDAYRAASRR